MAKLHTLPNPTPGPTLPASWVHTQGAGIAPIEFVPAGIRFPLAPGSQSYNEIAAATTYDATGSYLLVRLGDYTPHASHGIFIDVKDASGDGVGVELYLGNLFFIRRVGGTADYTVQEPFALASHRWLRFAVPTDGSAATVEASSDGLSFTTKRTVPATDFTGGFTPAAVSASFIAGSSTSTSTVETDSIVLASVNVPAVTEPILDPTPAPPVILATRAGSGLPATATVTFSNTGTGTISPYIVSVTGPGAAGIQTSISGNVLTITNPAVPAATAPVSQAFTVTVGSAGAPDYLYTGTRRVLRRSSGGMQGVGRRGGVQEFVATHTSANTSIATVDAVTGVVTAVNIGTTTITATDPQGRVPPKTRTVIVEADPT